MSRIEQLERHCLVTAADGRVFRARRVVVTIPPAVQRDVDFVPEIPPQRRELLNSVICGRAVKTIAVYDSKFWQTASLDGIYSQNVNYGPDVSGFGPVDNLFEARLNSGSLFALVGLITGRKAGQFCHRGVEEIRKEVLAQYQAVFANPKAMEPLAFICKEWTSETYTQGCFMANFPPRLLTSVADHLRKPFRLIHWAGTETASQWYGYFEGALQSGERAATEVLASMKHD